jgi:hypothetical protein
MSENAPSATAAEDALTEEERASGLRVMDPRWGYRHVLEPSGLVQPFDFDLSACAALRERFELRAHDIVIATYPKCGTTWMQQIVLLLLRGSSASIHPMRDAPWLEMSASSAANGAKSSSPPMSVDELSQLAPPDQDGSSGRRAWKTHAPAHAAPWRGGAASGAAAAAAKVIVVHRNPKDAAISMLHHTKNIPPFAFAGGWDEFAPLFLAGRVESSCFWKWHQSWCDAAAAQPEPFLFVSFESLKAGLCEQVARVAAFLGLERSEAELSAVASRCTFEAMRDEAAARDAAASKAGGPVKKGHFRQGRTGGWRDVMSAECAAAFDAKTAELYERCSLRFGDA